jgi:hypothetical protein
MGMIFVTSRQPVVAFGGPRRASPRCHFAVSLFAAIAICTAANAQRVMPTVLRERSENFFIKKGGERNVWNSNRSIFSLQQVYFPCTKKP